jgi:hypothetical protein
MLARALAHAPEYALKPAYQVRTFQHNGWHIRSSCRPDVNFTCVLEADRQAGSTLVALRLQRATIAYAPDPVDKNLKKEDFTGFFRPSPSAKTMADGSVIAGDQKWVKIHFDPEGELAALLDRLDSIRVE